jgi:hypothetical protein
MMKGSFTYWIFGVLWIFSACTDIVELEYPVHDPLLVVNSVVNTRDPWQVQVSASKGLNNNDFYPLLDEAEVELYQGEKLLGQLQSKGNGMYTSAEDERPEPGATYTLKVRHSDYTDVQASIRMPEVPVLSLPVVDYVKDTENRTSSGKWIQLTTTLEDDLSREDFYFVRAFSKDSAYAYQEDTMLYFNNYRTIRFPVPINEPGFLGMQMFTDRTFQGKAHELTFLVEYYGDVETFIQIGKISRSLYDYTQTYNGQINYEESPFGQPNPVSNNIESGLGIFGGYSFKSYILKNG